MADLTPQQAQAVQAIAAQVETAHRELVRSRTALSILINAGRASCNDVKTYNLLVKSTYFYQKSMADTIRGMGGDAPEVQPPLYVAWRGVAGDAAINIDCSQVNGPVAGETFLDPRRVEWRSGATPGDVQMLQQALAGVQLDPAAAARAIQQNGHPGLGVAPLILAVVPIILWGVVIAVAGAIILKIVEVLKDVPAKVEYTKQTAIAAERHRSVLEQRAKCLTDCAAAGKDATACAKSCARLFPEFTPPTPMAGVGILGWVLGAVVIGGIAWFGYRWYRGSLNGAGRRELEDGDDDGDEDDDAIDVDFLERVA